MELPRVKIQFLNGQLGTVGESADGLMALVCGADVVNGKLTLNQPYELRSTDDLEELGVTAANNPTLWKHVTEFYDEAGTGVKLVIYPVAGTQKMTDLCDYTKNVAGTLRDLITRENGALRGIGIAGVNTGSTDKSQNGLDADVLTALKKAQQLAEWATTELYAPLFVVLEGKGYDATKELADLTDEESNRVAVLIGDTRASSGGACMGTLMGRIAGIPVQRNIGRVKDGSLNPTVMYIGSKKVDESSTEVAKAYEKGYIVPRKHVGRSGYYFADDPMACKPTDDYAHLTARRTIDKAYRVAYDTLIDELLDELEVNEDGTLQYAVAKSWQQTLENAVNRQMTASGELSSGSDGEGCSCYIDATQNVVSTGKIAITLKVRPYGYARYIDVNLGFDVTSNN